MISSVTAFHFPDACLAAAVAAFGDVHIVVNNAGYFWNGGIYRQSDEQWDAIQDIHLKAPFRLLCALQLGIERDQG